MQINSHEVIIKRTAMFKAGVRSRPGKKQTCLSREAERLRARWRDGASQFMVLIAHLGYRQAGRTAEAQKALEEAGKNCDTSAWPYLVIRCLRGEISSEELLQAANDTGKKTEAHTYLGMDLLLKGRSAEAREHLIKIYTLPAIE